MSNYPGIPTYWLSRKELLERAITRRREKEARHQRQCEENCRYFNDLHIDAVKHDAWTSGEMYRASMEAHRAKVAKENKERNLDERKTKLMHLLKIEKAQYELELKHLADRRYTCVNERQPVESQRIVEVKKSDEDKRLNEVYNDWLERKRSDHKVAMPQQKEKYEDEDKEIEELILEDEKRSPNKTSQLEDVITNYVKELQLKEIEANKLKKELETLQQKQWNLEELDLKRQECLKKQSQQKEIAHQLKHQLKVQLQKRTREIVSQVQEDLEMLRIATLETERDGREEDLQRQHNRKNADRVRRAMEEQLEEEKRRQMELDTLFNEEAGRVWRQREDQWRRERHFRHELMLEVLDGLRKQTEEKLAENLKKQQENVKVREHLLRMIEESKEKMKQNSQMQIGSHQLAWRECDVTD